MGETGHGLVEDRKSLYSVTEDPIYAVLSRAVIRHLVGGLKRNVCDAAALTTHNSLTTV